MSDLGFLRLMCPDCELTEYTAHKYQSSDWLRATSLKPESATEIRSGVEPRFCMVVLPSESHLRVHYRIQDRAPKQGEQVDCTEEFTKNTVIVVKELTRKHVTVCLFDQKSGSKSSGTEPAKWRGGQFQYIMDLNITTDPAEVPWVRGTPAGSVEIDPRT